MNAERNKAGKRFLEILKICRRGVDSLIFLWDNQYIVEAVKCPRYDSKQVYYRTILREFVCRRCGYTWKAGGAVPTEGKAAREEGEETQLK